MAESSFAIELDEKKGRVLVTRKALDQGEIILQERPLGKLKKTFEIRKLNLEFFSSWLEPRLGTCVLGLLQPFGSARPVCL